MTLEREPTRKRAEQRRDDQPHPDEDEWEDSGKHLLGTFVHDRNRSQPPTCVKPGLYGARLSGRNILSTGYACFLLPMC
jgi:hypothetical protein